MGWEIKMEIKIMGDWRGGLAEIVRLYEKFIIEQYNFRNIYNGNLQNYSRSMTLKARETLYIYIYKQDGRCL